MVTFTKSQRRSIFMHLLAIIANFIGGVLFMLLGAKSGNLLAVFGAMYCFLFCMYLVWMHRDLYSDDRR